MKKKVFLMLPCIAAVTIATIVGKKTLDSNAVNCNELFAQNVEALSYVEENNVPNGYVLKLDPIQTKTCWKQDVDPNDFEIRTDYNDETGEKYSYKVYKHYWRKYTRQACVLLRIEEAPAWFQNCSKRQDALCDTGDRAGNQPNPLTWYE